MSCSKKKPRRESLAYKLKFCSSPSMNGCGSSRRQAFLRALTSLIMTTIIERRRPLPTLPNELWAQVISHFSIIDKATRSDVETWADITRTDKNTFGFVTDALIWHDDIARTKSNLGKVSKLFRRLSRSVRLEFIQIRTYERFCALSRSIRESTTFANDLTRYTLRLDCVFEYPHAYYDDIVKAEVDIHSVLRACPRLKAFAWFVAGLSQPMSDVFLSLPIICPDVEILFWENKAVIDPSPLDQFTKLRVFHCSWNTALRVGSERLLLPHLHTFSGSRAFLRLIEDKSCVRNLRTFRVFTGLSFPEISPAPPPFLQAHGGKIKSLWNLGQLPSGAPFDRLLPNITDLVVHVLEWRVLTTLPWPSLKHIGVDSKRHYKKEHILDLLKGIGGAKGEDFPKLQDIRIMGKCLVERVRQALIRPRNVYMQTLSERLLEKRIKLLDREGDSLL